MQVGRAAFVSFFCIVAVVVVLAQQPSKPHVDVSLVPSEPIAASGDCKSDTGGYLLGKNNETTPTKSEIGEIVSDKLSHGYILTIYPPTKSGIFVGARCTNVPALSEPSH